MTYMFMVWTNVQMVLLLTIIRDREGKLEEVKRLEWKEKKDDKFSFTPIDFERRQGINV